MAEADSFDDHQRAIQAFVSAARALAPAAWEAPRKEGAWSPGEITEHLSLAYETITRELRGGESVRVRTGFLRRAALRLVYLGRILRTRNLPKGVRAPRELRPAGGPFDQQKAVARLEACARSFEAAARERLLGRDAALTHHLFGRIELRSGVRFVAIHVDHHRRQLGT